MVGSNVRTDELTVGGYFAGISGGGILIARKKDWKIFRVSRRHVRVHEGMYIELCASNASCLLSRWMRRARRSFQ